MLPYGLVLELRGYIDENGNRRFATWFDGLDATAAAKVTIAPTRVGEGNFSNAKGIGGGVDEYKIRFRAGIPPLFRQGRRAHCHPARRRYEEAAAERYRDGAGALG